MNSRLEIAKDLEFLGSVVGSGTMPRESLMTAGGIYGEARLRLLAAGFPFAAWVDALEPPPPAPRRRLTPEEIEAKRLDDERIAQFRHAAMHPMPPASSSGEQGRPIPGTLDIKTIYGMTGSNMHRLGGE